MYCNEHVSRITSQKSQKFARILQHNSVNHTHSLKKIECTIRRVDLVLHIWKKNQLTIVT